ncbi:oxidoreductase [Rathayibacter sp. KR2-224]|uniref:oxidoreductase n=1 Tax=Rathayibacter sp. KR2-224 TaxID=3400913 RepID=UPI003C10C0E3
MTTWTASDIPDQTGRTAIVTGANSGLGLVTATELARHGAQVILAIRKPASGGAAADGISAEVRGAKLEVRTLDVASLASVRTFASRIAAEYDGIDLLINNAGAENLAGRQSTVDGFEFHLGTNMLGHFALTGLLLDTIARGAEPRIVSLSSITHKRAHLDFDDLQWEKGFNANRAYGASKLATTAFGIELNRRLRKAGSPIISTIAHPGLSRSNFIDSAWKDRGAVAQLMGRMFSAIATQPTEQGALNQLHAATAPGVQGGDFFGPGGTGERKGEVTRVAASKEAQDPAIGRRLWSAAEALTGITYL